MNKDKIYLTPGGNGRQLDFKDEKEEDKGASEKK